MKEKMEKFFKPAQNVHFTNNEKSQIKERVVSFMESDSFYYRYGLSDNRQGWYRNLSGKMMFPARIFNSVLGWKYVSVTLLFLVFSVSGVSMAASNALPGDPLYSVKINFNEEVLGMLAFSEESKVAWEEQRIERRLEEAQKLIMSGRITPELGEQIAFNLDKHVGKAISKIKGFESKDAGAVATLSSSFEITLAAHEEILESLARLDSTEELESLVVRVREKTNDISKIKTDAQEFLKENMAATLSVDDVADDGLKDKRRRAAERMRHSSLERVGQLEDMVSRLEKNGIINSEKISEASNTIAVSKNLIDKGENLLDSEKYGEAFFAFQDAFAGSHTVTLFLRAEATLNVDLNKKDDLDGSDKIVRDTDVLTVNGIPEFDSIDLDNQVEAIEEMESMIEKKLSAIETFIESNALPEEVAVEAKTGILVAENLALEGQEKASEDNFEEAFSLFRQSFSILLEISETLEIDQIDEEAEARPEEIKEGNTEKKDTEEIENQEKKEEKQNTDKENNSEISKENTGL